MPAVQCMMFASMPSIVVGDVYLKLLPGCSTSKKQAADIHKQQCDPMGWHPAQQQARRATSRHAMPMWTYEITAARTILSHPGLDISLVFQQHTHRLSLAGPHSDLRTTSSQVQCTV